VLALKIDPKDIQQEIQVDLWALTTIVNMERAGTSASAADNP
jgi:hypothetical protein